jgi:hypothetical protein
MKVGGEITKPTVRVDLFMLMVMYTMVTGKTIKPMDLESTVI